MSKKILTGFAATFLLIALPLTGAWLGGLPLDAYMEFPPGNDLHVQHAPFSWPIFIGLAVFEAAAILIAYLISRLGPASRRTSATRAFPWWGSLAILWTGLWWVLGWNRFPWFASLQHHTFTPLWLGYIVIVNALTWRSTGRCLLTHDTAYLLKLFPLSAGFWWFFEYLNRFVQNWTYGGIDSLTPLGYFIFATAAFATVLPAVMSTLELLEAWGIAARANQFLVRPPPNLLRALLVGSSLTGLLFLGLAPDYLYPLLWLAPMGVLLPFQSLENFSRIFPSIGTLLRLSAAALICGFFWELWNWHSLAKWFYHVPFVQKFHLFEMPALGYFGYLPFGWECACIAGLINRRRTSL